MSKKPRGLGSGFAALISQTAHVVTQTAQDRLINLAIDQLVSGRFQPRTQWDEKRLHELSESIRAQGVVQPIIVRSIAPQRYEIIAGERRWRAAQLAGLTDVPVLVKQMEDQEAMAVALIENIQREDLTAIEEANAIKNLVDVFGLTHEQIAQRVGRSRESISNLLRLLKLDTNVQQTVLDGLLSAGHVRALLSLTEEDQRTLAQQAILSQWSVREVEQAVKQILVSNPLPIKKEPALLSSEMQTLQSRVAQKMGTEVKLSVSASGKGKIEISFKNEEELQRVMSFF
jgi:ParB family chromosome partitioning protein